MLRAGSWPIDTMRYGGWSVRKWTVWETPKGVRREVFSNHEVLASVSFTEDNSLTQASLEALAAKGVDVGVEPHRDMFLPARRDK